MVQKWLISSTTDVLNKYQSYTYRAAVALNKPYVTEIKDNCSSEDCFKGIFGSVWHALREKMNFTYTIRKEKVYGSFINGTWIGMIGRY